MQATRTFWITAILATLWNAIGVAQYLMQVTMTDEALQALTADMQAYFEQVPTWVTGAFAVAVWAGFAGSIALCLRKTFASLLFSVSLAGIIAQLFYNVAMQTALPLNPALLAGPALILVIAIALLVLSKKWAAAGILR